MILTVGLSRGIHEPNLRRYTFSEYSRSNKSYNDLTPDDFTSYYDLSRSKLPIGYSCEARHNLFFYPIGDSLTGPSLKAARSKQKVS